MYCYECPYTSKVQRKYGVTTHCNLEPTNMDVTFHVIKKDNNRNYLLTRHHSYENEGRFQNEDEAKEVRKEIIDKLNQYNIKYEEIASTESNCEYIVEEVMEEIRNEQ